MLITEEILSTTSSNESGQDPLLMVQRNVTDVPGTRLLTLVLGVFALAIVAVPLITVHVPIPFTGVLPASDVEVTLHKF